MRYGKNKAMDERVESLIRLEVLACQSYLVDKLFRDSYFSWDDVVNLYLPEDDTDGETKEIFEWWLVTSELASDLKVVHEAVLDNDYGQWWGRTCTGQSIAQDGTMYRVIELIDARIRQNEKEDDKTRKQYEKGINMF
jgi:hypothetical protein